MLTKPTVRVVLLRMRYPLMQLVVGVAVALVVLPRFGRFLRLGLYYGIHDCVRRIDQFVLLPKGITKWKTGSCRV